MHPPHSTPTQTQTQCNGHSILSYLTSPWVSTSWQSGNLSPLELSTVTWFTLNTAALHSGIVLKSPLNRRGTHCWAAMACKEGAWLYNCWVSGYPTSHAPTENMTLQFDWTWLRYQIASTYFATPRRTTAPRYWRSVTKSRRCILWAFAASFLARLTSRVPLTFLPLSRAG